MRVNDDYAETWNTLAQIQDPNSVWTFWKKALATRKQHEVLVSHLRPALEFVPALSSNVSRYTVISN